MIPIKFKKISKSVISSSFCLQRLVISPFVTDVSVFLTGRTGSGKTTLVNLLAGENYFCSTGFQDCTNEINLLELPIGLKVFDLPGVCSDDRLENYNRAAFAIEQLADLDNVDNLTIVKKSADKLPIKYDYKASEFSEKFKSDLIFLLFAPDKQFLRHDREYLTELLKHHHQVIYLFNMFADEQGNQNFATPQNIADATEKITRIHKSILGEDKQPKIIHLNCKTGEGIDKLFKSSREILGLEKGKLFQELIDYQNAYAPDAYVSRIKQEVLGLSAYTACQKPSLNNNQELWETFKQLWNFLNETLLEKAQTIPEVVEQAIKDLVEEITTECVEKHYEAEVKIEYKPIYESVPDFKTVCYQVDDYTRPIVSTITSYLQPANFFEGLNNFLSYSDIRTVCHNEEIVGYEKKTVYEKQLNGYKQKYSHTEEIPVQTGRKIFKGETYHYFKDKAIIFILVFARLIASGEIEQYQNKHDVKAEYDILSRNIARRVGELVSFSDEPEFERVLSLLEPHVDRLVVLDN